MTNVHDASNSRSARFLNFVKRHGIIELVGWDIKGTGETVTFKMGFLGQIVELSGIE
jgi:hypothetical protein